MNILQKAANWIGETLTTKKKWVDYPTISGGFDIFRGLAGWTTGWSKTKLMQTYQTSLYVFACVSKIAQKTASIDWELRRIKNSAGDTVEVAVHPILDLLYRPNAYQTKTEFFEKYLINKKLTGENFVLKVRKNGPGTEVVELWNLRPDYMRVVQDKDLNIIGYEFSGGAKVTVFRPEDIIHDAYPSPLSELTGISPIQPAQSRVETEAYATQYQGKFFQNNARPDFLLMSEKTTTNTQKEDIRESWDKRHKGTANAGRLGILDGGMKYQQVSMSQREMDYIESLKMTRDDILTAFSVPKPIVAITDDVNLANAKTAMDIFLSETIKPEINRITEKLNEHLVYPEFGDIFYIDFEDPTPENEKAIADLQQVQLQSGVLLINEAREVWGLPPVAGGWNLYMPLSNVPVGGLSQSGKAQTRLRSRKAPSLSKTFRGRNQAFEIMKIRDAFIRDTTKKVEAAVLKQLPAHTVVKKVEATSKAEPVQVKYKAIVPTEQRGAYFDVVNKAIDQKASAYKPRILDFAEEQKARILENLKDQYKGADKVKALKGLFDVQKENKLFSELSLPFIQEFLVTAGKEALAQIAPAEQFTVSASIEAYIKARAKAVAKEVNATTVDKLSRTLAEGINEGEGISALTDRVNTVYEEYQTYRAEMIARTEATAANNRGFIESYDQSGVANAKEWISTNDGSTRDTHAAVDGEIVGLNETFSNGLEYPGDPSGDPSETINCRCVIAPAFKE